MEYSGSVYECGVCLVAHLEGISNSQFYLTPIDLPFEMFSSSDYSQMRETGGQFFFLSFLFLYLFIYYFTFFLGNLWTTDFFKPCQETGTL